MTKQSFTSRFWSFIVESFVLYLFLLLLALLVYFTVRVCRGSLFLFLVPLCIIERQEIFNTLKKIYFSSRKVVSTSGDTFDKKYHDHLKSRKEKSGAFDPLYNVLIGDSESMPGVLPIFFSKEVTPLVNDLVLEFVRKSTESGKSHVSKVMKYLKPLISDVRLSGETFKINDLKVVRAMDPEKIALEVGLISNVSSGDPILTGSLFGFLPISLKQILVQGTFKVSAGPPVITGKLYGAIGVSCHDPPLIDWRFGGVLSWLNFSVLRKSILFLINRFFLVNLVWPQCFMIRLVENFSNSQISLKDVVGILEVRVDLLDKDIRGLEIYLHKVKIGKFLVTGDSIEPPVIKVPLTKDQVKETVFNLEVYDNSSDHVGTRELKVDASSLRMMEEEFWMVTFAPKHDLTFRLTTKLLPVQPVSKQIELRSSSVELVLAILVLDVEFFDVAPFETRVGLHAVGSHRFSRVGFSSTKQSLQEQFLLNFNPMSVKRVDIVIYRVEYPPDQSENMTPEARKGMVGFNMVNIGRKSVYLNEFTQQKQTFCAALDPAGSFSVTLVGKVYATSPV